MPIQALIADADVVLAVGTELGETDIYTATQLPLGGLLIRIDIDPVKLSDHYAADVPVWGDARSSLQAIQQGLPPRSGWNSRTGGAPRLRREIESSVRFAGARASCTRSRPSEPRCRAMGSCSAT